MNGTQCKAPMSITTRTRAPYMPQVDISPRPAAEGPKTRSTRTAATATPVSSETNNFVSSHRIRRSSPSSLLNKSQRSSEAAVEGSRGRESYVEADHKQPSQARLGNRAVEQYYAPLRRRAERHKRNEVGADHELLDLRFRLEEKEKLVMELQAEVASLKARSEKLQNLNAELEAENDKLRADMATAQAKIPDLPYHRHQNVTHPHSVAMSESKFLQTQKLIADKLEQFKKKTGMSQVIVATATHISTDREVMKSTTNQAKVVEAGVSSKVAPSSSPTPPPPPPPPPPPLPRQPRAQAARPPTYLQSKQDPARITSSAVAKAPSLLEFYQSFKKLDTRKESHPAAIGSAINTKPANIHNSIVGEIQSRSSHLLAIKADVETKGEFINFLIQKIKSTVFADIEELLTFVEWLDMELSSLSDERAVLRHFDWPEKKADAMREAAFEYRDLKHLVTEISSYEDDPTSPCETALRKMTNLLDKSEKSIDKLIKLRESSMQHYRDSKIPTEWMLQSGVISQIKLASVKLARLYLKRVSQELNLDKECSTQEGLLRQCVHFAYRAHQFAGGLDADTMCALEEIRHRIPVRWGGSREMIAGMS